MFNLIAALIVANSPASEPEPEHVYGRIVPTVQGRATYYGSYFNGRRLGCSPPHGGTYWATDATIAAVPSSRDREWPCGTPLRITGPANPDYPLTVIRRDTCPGCDAHRVVIDLSEAASSIVCGAPSTCNVLIEPLLPPRQRATLSPD